MNKNTPRFLSKLQLLILSGALATNSHALLPTPDAPPVKDGQVRIGAWNIENLGLRGARGGETAAPEKQQKAEDLAAYILASHVDLLSLEEIHDDDQTTDKAPGTAPWKSKILDEILVILGKATNDKWQYELTGPGPDNVRCQMTGVLWRTSRLTLKERAPLPVKGGNHPHPSIEASSDEDNKLTYWTRRPEAFLFSAGEGKTDLAVIPLHMKSNSDEKSVGIDMRKVEAQQLIDALPSLKGPFEKEKDWVLLGDTNITLGEKSVQEIWKDFTDLNAKEALTWMNPYFSEKQPPGSRNLPPAPFDRIFIPTGQPEFKQSEEHVHAPLNASKLPDHEWVSEHKRFRSDHLLVWCDLTVEKDDD
ncbi:hypothetical protein [Luteolibacter soli]|uniref:Endonuclease/exonuclease/phosphatase domain-containing protein n=1 Tax=Luteolibacter soli TaxID=3135280 RepID=A0ABU9ANR4_9BACT